MTRPFGPEPEDLADVHAAADAAASVRFQPTEDTSVCPACFHAPHWGGMCDWCLCFKVRAGRGAQPVDESVDEPELPRGRHRREVPKSSKLARLRKAFRRG